MARQCSPSHCCHLQTMVQQPTPAVLQKGGAETWPRPQLPGQARALCLQTPPAPSLGTDAPPESLVLGQRCLERGMCPHEHPLKQREEAGKSCVSESLVWASCRFSLSQWDPSGPSAHGLGVPAGNGSSLAATHSCLEMGRCWSPALLRNQPDGIPAVISNPEDFILSWDSVSHRR